MPGLRISAISFLNTAPLMWDLEHGDAARHFDIEYTIPSLCAAAIAANQADIGIIPAFAYAEIPGLVILPNIAIAAKDRVRSILLVSKGPIEEVETVATDSSSRTSVALLQVLFTKLIGDAALQVPADSGYHLYDLAHEWRARTGKPFVFAFWAVRLDALNRRAHGIDLAKVFQSSRDHGLQPENVATIAKEWSPKLALSLDEIRQYLTENIHYYLDRENHAGLQLFLQYAQEIELIREVPELRFLGPVAFGSSRK